VISAITDNDTTTTGGDLSGAQTGATVVGLRGNAISATVPNTNEFLKFDGTSWVPSTLPSQTSLSTLTVDTSTLVVDESADTVGIGAAPSTGSKLEVAGVIESTSGGIKFPDGTTQTSAYVSTMLALSPQSAEPFACDGADDDGKVSLTSLYDFCICNFGTGWVQPGTSTSCSWQGFGIVVNGSGRKWSDNSFAATCNEYINPPSGYYYTGLTGSGVYTIDPDGSGGNTEYDVYCDMDNDGGGWTLFGVAVNGQANALASASAVNTNLKAPYTSGDSTWKLADSEINAIGSIMRLSCHDEGITSRMFYKREGGAAWSSNTLSGSSYKNACSPDNENWSGFYYHTNRYLVSDWTDIATTDHTGANISATRTVCTSGNAHIMPIVGSGSVVYCSLTTSAKQDNINMWIR
jgi:hypothetical protein